MNDQRIHCTRSKRDQTNKDKRSTTENRNSSVGKGKMWRNAISKRIQGDTYTSKNDTIIDEKGMEGDISTSQKNKTMNGNQTCIESTSSVDTIQFPAKNNERISRGRGDEKQVDSKQIRSGLNVSTISPNATKGDIISGYDSQKDTILDKASDAAARSRGESDERKKNLVEAKVSTTITKATKTAKIIEKSDVDANTNNGVDSDIKSLKGGKSISATTVHGDKTHSGIENKNITRIIDSDASGGQDNSNISTDIGRFDKRNDNGDREEEVEEKRTHNSSTNAETSVPSEAVPRDSMSENKNSEYKENVEDKSKIESGSNSKDDESDSGVSTATIPVFAGALSSPNAGASVSMPIEKNQKEENESKESVGSKSKSIVDSNTKPIYRKDIGGEEAEKSKNIFQHTKNTKQVLKGEKEDTSKFSSSKPTISSNENRNKIGVEEKEELSDTIAKANSNGVEVDKENSSERDETTKDAKGTNIPSTNDQRNIDETTGNSIDDSLDVGYFFTKRDDTENSVNAENEMMDLLLDDDHLSWLTAPNSQSDNGESEETQQDQIYDDGYEILKEFAFQRGDDLSDEGDMEVDDTYVLGEQIAFALDKGEIDVVGLADGETIAPALADALLYSIERDAYDRMNEGWNQFGAESLYSIGEDKEDIESDDDAFSDELIEEISTQSTTTNELESIFGDEEELILVADSIMDIINGEEDEDEEAIEPYSDSSSDAIDIDEDDEPPTFHKYVLKVDRTG